MKLRITERKKAKIKMALQGSAGSGKTMSAILLAKGLTNDNLSKVALIDTENGSSDLYAHLGNYNVLNLNPPYTPEKYIEAIDICLKANMDLIILDSISHCWEELIDYHSKIPGNSFTSWNKVTPRHNSFVDKILQSPTHIIATMRTKQDYVLNQKNGKYVPEKIGLKAVQRDGINYEFTIVFDIDSNHHSVASKDRTNLFSGKTKFIINTSTGRKILDWCEIGMSLEKVRQEIAICETVEGLKRLYDKYNSHQKVIYPLILERKAELETTKSQIIDKENIVEPNKIYNNGTNN